MAEKMDKKTREVDARVVRYEDYIAFEVKFKPGQVGKRIFLRIAKDIDDEINKAFEASTSFSRPLEPIPMISGKIYTKRGASRVRKIIKEVLIRHGFKPSITAYSEVWQPRPWWTAYRYW